MHWRSKYTLFSVTIILQTILSYELVNPLCTSPENNEASAALPGWLEGERVRLVRGVWSPLPSGKIFPIVIPLYLCFLFFLNNNNTLIHYIVTNMCILIYIININTLYSPYAPTIPSTVTGFRDRPPAKRKGWMEMVFLRSGSKH